MDYRNRQLGILHRTLNSIAPYLERLQSSSTICSHASHMPSSNILRTSRVEKLSLECAFSWLQKYYPDVFHAVTKLISEDQGESLPLDWAILVEDWDHVYWIVWLLIIQTIRMSSHDFGNVHPYIDEWLKEMTKAYTTEAYRAALADESERETIETMINGIKVSKSTHECQAACGRIRLDSFVDPSRDLSPAQPLGHLPLSISPTA